ncbi:methyltransferase domain-containing protein [Beijerinckia mobilis]|uniref:methyltransferase domain-containing protein n=1 Tax=Beijerinckia mobilis TaxID=231434 RepID=UPI000556726F|nr:methyltransferase domain-containing protein [Beijerinckia mobilis]
MALLKAQRSSGDYLADRRFAYAQAAAADNDLDAARDLVLQTLELAETFAPAWFLLGEIYERCDDRAHAIEAYTRVLACDPSDELGAALHLGRLGVPPPAAASPRFVASLFDHYADTFDTHLTQQLNYRGPLLLRRAWERLSKERSGGSMAGRVLDLGCGTGLAGLAFRDFALSLAGVDLSPRMVEAAREKGIYDRLAVAALEDFLAAEPEAQADLIIAADVFVYIGDLAPVFRAARRALKTGGTLLFTVQAAQGSFQADIQAVSQGAPYEIGSDLRFSHAESYLREVIAATGLTLALKEDVATREDAGRPMPGYLMAVRA